MPQYWNYTLENDDTTQCCLKVGPTLCQHGHNIVKLHIVSMLWQHYHNIEKIIILQYYHNVVTTKSCNFQHCYNAVAVLHEWCGNILWDCGPCSTMFAQLRMNIVWMLHDYTIFNVSKTFLQHTGNTPRINYFVSHSKNKIRVKNISSF